MKYLIILLMVTFIGCSKNEVKQTDAGTNGNNTTKSGETTQTSKTDGTTNTTSSGNSNADVVKIDLPSVQCSMCKKTIETALKKDAGVINANVDYKNKNATVEFDKSKTGKETIEGLIIAAGYQANEKPADEKAYNELHGCCKLPKDQK
ncbi:MAG: heavy-metal-associated domain-containing protein [Ignavibacteria bacterium]|nr:heavy-metal-associated domain-containing protein [Ignavibacteria bacterium]